MENDDIEKAKELKRLKRNEYRRKKYRENPEKAIASNERWRINNPEKVKEMQKKRYNKNPEKYKKYSEKWRKNNPEKYHEIVEKSTSNRMKRLTCEIIKQHHKDFKDDPDCLSTEFIQELIGIKCKPDNRNKMIDNEIQD